MRAISLFSGAGGFEIGFARAGVQTVLQAESDPWCLQVLKRHWPEVERVRDVRNVRDDWCGVVAGVRRTKPSRATGWDGQRVDLIYGGFPCQDLSVAGRRAGLSGERSGLFFEFARVVRELRPRWFALENVPGLLSSAEGADFGTILSVMVDLGYGVAWRVLDARWFGVPQRRRRVFVVGCLGDPARAASVLAVCESCGGHPQTRPEAREAVAYSLAASVRGTGDGHGNAWNSNYVASTLRSRAQNPGVNMAGRGGEDDDNLVVAGTLGSDHGNIRADQAWTNRLFAFGGNNTSGTIDIASARSSRANRYDFDTDTFLSNAAGVRRLTPLECERLMGWPDGWTRYTADGREIPDSHRYRMCGNGVIATVAEWLGHRLMRADAFVEVAA